MRIEEEGARVDVGCDACSSASVAPGSMPGRSATVATAEDRGIIPEAVQKRAKRMPQDGRQVREGLPTLRKLKERRFALRRGGTHAKGGAHLSAEATAQGACRLLRQSRIGQAMRACPPDRD